MASPSSLVVVGLLAFLYVGFLPLLVFLHELAHAAVALAFTDDAVRIEVGADPEYTLAAGRLTVAATPLSGAVGCYRFAGEMDPRQRAAVSLAGPAASLFVCLATIGLLRGVAVGPSAAFLLRGAAFAAGFQFLVTLAPIRYPAWWADAYAGLASDGRQAIDALRG